VVLDLLLIGLGITLEPFPLTAFILILSAEKGTWKGLAFLLGWLACLVAVIAAVILTTGNSPPKPQTAPSTAALAVKLALGVVLILLAMRRRRQMGRPRKPPAWMAHLDRLSLWSAAGLAVFLQPWVLVAAGATTVIGAKLSTAGSYLALVFFCLLATSSFLYLELYATFASAKTGARLARLRAWLDSHQDQVVIAVFLLLGLWLAAESISLLVS
jgi:hypothetical protein